MSIGDQFSGLDMHNLIGAPLSASADASVQLAQSTADFINNVGFDADGNTRTVNFKFDKVSHNDDGTSNQDQMNVNIPLLAIVPIPNLQIDEVNVLFDMEVKQTEKSESSKDFGGSTSISAGFFGVKATVTGSVSSHSSNTRSTDNSAKYHVDVTATNHGTPEGLSRVLDMMAANVAPALIGSTAVDEHGKALNGDRKARNDKLKALKAKCEQSNLSAAAAEKALDNSITQLKRLASSTQNKYCVTLSTLINKSSSETEIETFQNNMNLINTEWQNFQSNAKQYVEMSSSTEGDPQVGTFFALKGVNVDGSTFDYATSTPKNASDGVINYADASPDIVVINTSYKTAVDSTRKFGGAQDLAATTNKEYNDFLCTPETKALPE